MSYVYFAYCDEGKYIIFRLTELYSRDLFQRSKFIPHVTHRRKHTDKNHIKFVMVGIHRGGHVSDNVLKMKRFDRYITITLRNIYLNKTELITNCIIFPHFLLLR